MERANIKIIEKGSKKRVFIDGVEQRGVKEVYVGVYPAEITEIQITYYPNKFEIIKED